MEAPLAQRLASVGFVTATVEYRLSQEALYPAAVRDLKAAVRWLRARALDYHIDTTRIGVCGGSAGGHLAALLGATNGTRQYEEQDRNLGHSSEVQAVVDIDGPVDLTHPEESGKDQDPLKPSAGKLWIGSGFKERPDMWREASPSTYRNDRTPPIAFINSSIARFHVGRDEMIKRLKSMDIYTEVHLIPNTPHPFWLFHPWFEQTATYVETFFIKILKKQ
jgi:pectinesterase